MTSKRKWDLGAGAAFLVLFVVVVLGAAGFGITRYYEWQREKKQFEIQGQFNYAAANGDAAQVRALLGRGASVNGLSREGHTALHGAAMLGKNAIVELLLTAGADPNVHRPGTSTPLYVAVDGSAIGDSLALVKMLLEAGADPNGRSSDPIRMVTGSGDREIRDQTALMRAMITQRDEIIRLLLKHGADPNLTDSEGKTALHWWVFFRRGDRIGLALGPLLVRKGADPHKADKSGKSPLEYARELGDRRMLAALEKAAASQAKKAAEKAKAATR